jgi:succinate dehydrogenase/fumarate reductase flavoprotein subunit
MRTIPELCEHGVALHAEARDVRIGMDAVSFTGPDGETHAIPADHVIVAKGARGDSTLADTLRAEGLPVAEIGDGVGIGYIEGAMRGAARAVLGRAAIPPL